MQADVFLSYAEEDRARAGLLTNALETLGWTVWWDREIAPGSTWRETIERAIDGARCMVVLWSASAIASRWVHEEAEEGLARSCLVPVLIEQVRPPMGFRSVQACDLSHWEGDTEAAEFASLVKAISSLAGSPPRAAPALASVAQSAPSLPASVAPPPSHGRRAWTHAVVLVTSVLAVASMWWLGNATPPPDPLPTQGEISLHVEPPGPNGVASVPVSPAPLPDLMRADAASGADPAGPVGVAPIAVSPAPVPDVARADVASGLDSPAPRVVPRPATQLSSSTLSARCAAVLERMQLGEPLSDSERKECTR